MFEEKIIYNTYTVRRKTLCVPKKIFIANFYKDIFRYTVYRILRNKFLTWDKN